MAFFEKDGNYLVHKEYPVEGKEFPYLELCIEKVKDGYYALHINYWFKEKRFDGPNGTDKGGKSLIKGAEIFTRLKDAKQYGESFADGFLFGYKLGMHREGIEI